MRLLSRQNKHFRWFNHCSSSSSVAWRRKGKDADLIKYAYPYYSCLSSYDCYNHGILILLHKVKEEAGLD